MKKLLSIITILLTAIILGSSLTGCYFDNGKKMVRTYESMKAAHLHAHHDVLLRAGKLRLATAFANLKAAVGNHPTAAFVNQQFNT